MSLRSGWEETDPVQISAHCLWKGLWTSHQVGQEAIVWRSSMRRSLMAFKKAESGCCMKSGQQCGDQLESYWNSPMRDDCGLD